MSGFSRFAAIAVSAGTACAALCGSRPASAADTAADRAAFQQFFHAKFPGLTLSQFAEGPYALDPAMRAQWQDIMQIPPYDFAVEEGRHLFETKFADGRSYASCLRNGGIGTRQIYPYFDVASGQVVTLPDAINMCRTAHHEAPLDVETGAIASIDAYIAKTSRGHVTDVAVPDDRRAVSALAEGKRLFEQQRGPSHFSCAGCHVGGAGARPDAGTIAPALGILASFPIYRSAWGNMGTAARRIRGCDKSTGGPDLPADSYQYRAIEFYLATMSNGVPVAGPGARP